MTIKNLKDTAAHKTLLKLSENPFDLTETGVLTKERLKKFKSEAGALQMLYGTQRIDVEALAALQELADESGAVEQYKQMLSGETLNKIDGFEKVTEPL